MLSSLFFKARFYYAMAGMVLLFVLAFVFPVLLLPAQLLFMFFVLLFAYDCFLLFSMKDGIKAQRNCADRFSNGDDNSITLSIENKYNFESQLEILDEMPFQFQVRDLEWQERIAAKARNLLTYTLRPTKRGEYDFGALNVYATSPIGFISKRYRFAENQMVAVYPSYIEMHKYELAAFSANLTELGVKRMRKIGHSSEFEQIKEYVQGDDPRLINWKATARQNNLMVNQYEEEKSQRVYCIVDKGRLMKMPFNGLSLLDYAINSSLVISNIAIKKQDKAGLLTFGRKLSTYLEAEKKPGQMRKIQHALYKQKTNYKESNFRLLTAYISRKIRQRSLLLLFTNFESIVTFRRQLPYFKALSRRHLVVVIFFKNTGLDEMLQTPPRDMEGIYEQGIAESFVYDKEMMVKELNRNGILSILSKPEELTVQTVNKYLEVKARGAL